MRCRYCGSEADPDANFCSKCGCSFNSRNFIRGTDRKLGLWILPIITAVASVVWITGFYALQIKTSFDIDNFCERAENLGLDGKIDEAIKVIDKGLAIKPNNIALKNDRDILIAGESTLDHLNRVDNYISNGNYKSAENELQSAEDKLINLNGAFRYKLNKMIDQRRASVAVIKVKSQMNSNKNMDDLAVLLNEIEQYDTDEAREASSELRTYIGNTAYDRANECLKVKDFEAALDTVNEGLTYDVSNEKLISFKGTISNQKAAFEKTEKESMEQAMEAAAKEDNFNRTAALNLIASSGEFNNSGDFIIRGTVKNNATKAVSMVKIFYSIYDAGGNEVSNNSTYVYPNYIKPDDTGEFENTEYGMSKGCYIKITKITWYIE